MKTEKVVLSAVAILAGLLVAGVAFYLYQSTKTINPGGNKSISITPPTPTPATSSFLHIDSPQDEVVVDKKLITVSGTTNKDAVVVISTPLGDEVVTPSRNGTFTTTINIDDDENFVEITAILPNGLEQKEVRTVTYSTENF